MLINYNLLIKLFITILTICLSAYFFYVGYLSLNLYKSINPNPSNSKTNIDAIKNNYLSKPDNTEFLNESKKNKISTENEIIIEIKKNDTFSKIIDPYFENYIIKNKIINELNKEFNLKNLKIGQEIYIYQNSKKIVKTIIIPIDFSTDIEIEINETKITLTKKKIKITKDFESNKFFIKSSLYEDGKIVGVPLEILSEAIKLYSFDVDFQRDIQKNDEFEIFYEVFINGNKGNISYGKIKYIKLNLHGNILEYFIFKDEDDHFDYFNKEGKNARKALMKTPIDGARLSSSYGVRKHPILGYNKLHKGVDFAAPKGTPIYAAGNGVIDFVGKNGGYGKYIRIRHNSSYKTAYAHLSNYKKNIYKGIRVSQGEVIGYVGSTGKSTGPHLHYEVIYQNKQINPMKMKLPSGKILKDNELKKFNKEMKIIYSDFLFYLYE
ncbi:MAG: M23 family metallopeptidase [Pelagibacteraceae bacterium]|nr:M23 family metallopeptidase [Pelagibacteraceae bacterium]|tara:strand:+ start:355 stop:1665 length:1311 start_codon:yes stop_codon:yes gene_type:complete